ncbi:carboxypeptidase-like regulatory domain-containing protein [Halpernia frigidisoli]|uniref:CarboxypepD_reg-like domain-containing protein n=1 Tax=Halpernia frigidisoli TaxID=1125876 RepID=A0A1I3ITT2_9FLAO|nr:carboxypeptidase-like regulatory domain-containing protein [Halpernia frigidisoli]SFI51287.1 hypothetical protein SAMN05443292_2778 [Halpernia frigidisoli]
MKKIIFISLFFFCQIIFAQFIKGSVKDENDVPISNVSIYIDGSTINALTDEKGNFDLQTSIKTGNLIINKEDFSKVIFPVKDAIGKNLKVTLQKEKLIEEVSLIPYTDRDFERNFSIFQYAFLGDTNSTKILNKKDLLFAVDRKNNIFRAKAKHPLIIENENLGYTIQFDLINFEKAEQTLTYNGNTLFTEMRGSKKRESKFKEQREEAFIGSATHFFQSLFAEKTKENGFNINSVKIIPNPNYPTQLEMDQLNNYVKSQIDLNKIINLDAMPKDIRIISQKTKNSKTALVILKKSISENDYSYRKNGELFLKFDNLLQVVYVTKDQRIIDTLLDSDGETFQILADGYYLDQDKLIFNGTWGNYKISKMLPTDYSLK